MKKELTKAEEQIMHAIWQVEKGFAKDILDVLKDPKPAYNTVLTVIRVLVTKGFVKFKIQSKVGLAPNTPIFNTGHIYFDNNPAVITNTVLNTIDTLNITVSVKEIAFTNSEEVIVFPNPFQNQLTIYYKNFVNEEYNLSLFDITGKEVYRKENIYSNKTTIDLSILNEGIYIVVGVDKLGKRLFSERVIAQ